MIYIEELNRKYGKAGIWSIYSLHYKFVIHTCLLLPLIHAIFPRTVLNWERKHSFEKKCQCLAEMIVTVFHIRRTCLDNSMTSQTYCINVLSLELHTQSTQSYSCHRMQWPTWGSCVDQNVASFISVSKKCTNLLFALGCNSKWSYWLKDSCIVSLLVVWQLSSHCAQLRSPVLMKQTMFSGSC